MSKRMNLGASLKVSINMSKHNIYLVGFMGSGKSTIGQLLAKALGRSFVDLDDMVERERKLSVADIFDKFGEASFRQLETNALRTVGKRDFLVVGTGGGILENQKNLLLMKKTGQVVFLRTSFRICLARMRGDRAHRRPLHEKLKERFLKRLFTRRQIAYAKSDIVTETDHLMPSMVARDLMAKLVKSDIFFQDISGNKSSVVLSWNCPEILGYLAKASGRRVFLLTDKNVAKFHLARYLEALQMPAHMVISPGEQAKSIRVAEGIFKKLAEERFERGEVIVSLGGGVITDLGGFVASAYKRGMCHIPVATTLVGCVDAALGGKTALNLQGAKNVLGFFNLPQAVLLDVAALRTLKDVHFKEGIIEALKTGLVADAKLVEFIECHLEQIVKRDLVLVSEVILAAAKAKMKIVAKDFFDENVRHILNFGHTYGHALEAYCQGSKQKSGRKKSITHGSAVGVGIRLALEVSYRRGLLERGTADRIHRMLDVLIDLDVKLPSFNALKPIITQDKKMKCGQLGYVLLKGVGKPVYVSNMTLKELSRNEKFL